MPAASQPAFASVSPKAASFLPAAMSGRYFFFCSSLPNSSDGERAEPRAREGQRDAAARAAQLLHDERHLEYAAAEAAVFLRNIHAGQVGIGQYFHDVSGEFCLFVVFDGHRGDFFVGNLRGEFLYHLLLFGRK